MGSVCKFVFISHLFLQQHPQVVKPTNSLPFLKESEKDYWNKLLDSNIRAGTMACMWCLKTTYVKKISWAFYSWKLNAAKESWRGNNSPLKGFAQTSSLRTPSGSIEQIDERPQNSLRPVSTVLANAISLMNQLKETDAERDLNTRLFASPSASVKAANAMAASGNNKAPDYKLAIHKFINEC